MKARKFKVFFIGDAYASASSMVFENLDTTSIDSGQPLSKYISYVSEVSDALRTASRGLPDKDLEDHCFIEFVFTADSEKDAGALVKHMTELGFSREQLTCFADVFAERAEMG